MSLLKVHFHSRKKMIWQKKRLARVLVWNLTDPIPILQNTWNQVGSGNHRYEFELFQNSSLTNMEWAPARQSRRRWRRGGPWRTGGTGQRRSSRLPRAHWLILIQYKKNRNLNEYRIIVPYCEEKYISLRFIDECLVR